MDAFNIQIAVSANGAGVGPGLNVAVAAISRFEQRARSSFDRVQASFAGLSTGTKVLGGLGLALGGFTLALSKTIQPAIQFESAFAGVLKTVDGSTAQLDGIRQGLIDLSTVMPTTAVELAAIAENAGQLGVAAPDVLEFTEVVAQLGETTDLDFDSAAQSLARFLNVTGNDTSIKQLGDVIVELGNNSATTESQIVTFATRLASSLTVAGAREDEILALGAAFSSLGIEAEAGSSALSRVVTQIADSAKLGNDDLRVFAETAGLLPEQFAAIAEESPVEALLQFGEGLGRITEEGGSITPVLEDLELGGIRTSRVLQLLALASDDIRDSLALAAEQFTEGGAAAEEYARRAETTASRLEILRNRITAVAIAAGTPSLDLLARGADLAGDAIERLVELISPLAAELGRTFQNASSAAGAFFDVLGAPVLGTAVIALNGLLVSLTALLGVFNSFGPAGTVLAGLLAVLVAYPPALAAARAGALALSISIAATGTASTAAAIGLRALNVALAAGPFIAVAAALALVGKAFLDADSAARQASEAFRLAITDSIAESDVRGVTEGLDRITERMTELRGIAADTSTEGFFTRLGRAIKGTGEVLTPFTENTVLNANRELAALNDTLAAGEWGNFESSVSLASNALGLSESNIVSVAQELGVLEALTQGTNAEFFESVEVIRQATAAQSELAEALGVTTDEILTEARSLEDFERALGVTGEQLGFLATRIEGLELADLFSDNEAEVLAAAAQLEALNAVYEELAAELGISTERMRENLESVDALAASHNALQSAVEAARSALGALEAQQALANDATLAFEDALSRISDTASLEDAARAMRDLSLETAATGISAGEAAARQEEFARSLIEAARSAGIADEEIARVLVSLGLVPEETLAEITVKGEEAAADAEKVAEILNDLLGEYGVTITVEGAQGAIDILNEAARIAGALVGVYPITLTAEDDASDTIEGVKGLAERTIGVPYSLTLTAEDLASDVILPTREKALAFAESPYNASLTATDDGASGLLAILQNASDNYEDRYNAGLTATDDGASGQIRDKQSKADAYDGSYNATLTATDRASSVIQRAIRTLSGFRSKSITITTFLSTVRRSATGSVTSGARRSGGGAQVFAEGGIQVEGPAPVPAFGAARNWFQAQRATPGRAQIFQPTTPGRFFAEPETGGEAYIPLAVSKRARSLEIWEMTGRLLGALADGGIQGSFRNGGIAGASRVTQGAGGTVQIVNSVSVSVVAAEGQSERRIAALVGQSVRAEFAELGTDISNLRRGF